MSGDLALCAAISNYPHTRAIKNGSVAIDGIALEFAEISPQIAAYRRMVREVAFDVCELAITTYLVARAHGAPFVALPLFINRRFHHGGILVRPDSGITTPKDLEGKKVGVRAWSVTTGVWTRGVFMDEYGLDCDQVTWVVDDEEHVHEYRLPPNVVHAPEGRSLADMMQAREIHAAFAGNAGLGGQGKPKAGCIANAGVAGQAYADLIPDAAEQEAEWYRRTGIYPIHGVIVVKQSVLDRAPWVARSLCDAFAQAKAEWLSRLEKGEADSAAERTIGHLRAIVGDDPLPYGLEANYRSLAALQDYALRQHLIEKELPLEHLFVNPQDQ